MVSVGERHSKKGVLRYYLGLGFWIVVLVILNIIIFRPGRAAIYKVKTNEKGEIIELEKKE
jgi:hypothetical protein